MRLETAARAHVGGRRGSDRGSGPRRPRARHVRGARPGEPRGLPVPRHARARPPAAVPAALPRGEPALLRSAGVAGGPARGRGVREGIVPRWAIAAGARWLFDEPYCTRPMRHEGSGDEGPRTGEPLSYEWREGGRWHGLSGRAAAPIGPAAPGSLQEFVVERYWGYTRHSNGHTVEYRVGHPPWRLWAVDRPQVSLDGSRVYGERLGAFLAAPPLSAVIADGSPVTVSWGSRLLAD